VLEWWETKVRNCEVTPQAILPIVKSLIKRDGPKAPTAILVPLGLKYQLLDKAIMIVDSLENHLTPHDLCGENHKWWVETRVQALLEAADGQNPLGNCKTL
jgi:hypothetical protein